MSSGHPETRKKILDAAWGLLERDAGSTVRMGDIAKAAGVSRQALYLHFPDRAGLLIATTRHIDETNDIDARLAASRAAARGTDRLDAYIEAWGAYIPEIYGVARALMAMQDSDGAARAAWTNRMQAVRDGCAAAVDALDRDGALSPGLSVAQATDILWTLLSVRNWEQLTGDCGWPQARYIAQTKRMARRVLTG
tara:strand:- start:908 stop:1492 length:585 start_codon:yes stop_codon:yes gene_type:complete